MLHILTPIGTSRHPYNAQSIDNLRKRSPRPLLVHEVIGMSEVSRARNTVATQALESIRKIGGYVLWLDSDMVFTPDIIQRHTWAVERTGKAISGRYVKRNRPQELATVGASDEETTNGEYTLKGCFAGMGALMLPAAMFVRDLERSLTMWEDGKPHYHATHTVLVKRGSGDIVMVGEDAVYCQRLEEHEGGVWYAKDSLGWIDYGHVCQIVAYPEGRMSV